MLGKSNFPPGTVFFRRMHGPLFFVFQPIAHFKAEMPYKPGNIAPKIVILKYNSNELLNLSNQNLRSTNWPKNRHFFIVLYFLKKIIYFDPKCFIFLESYNTKENDGKS